MRQAAKRILEPLGLLPAARRVYRWLVMTKRIQTANVRDAVSHGVAADGLPIPPPRLRFLVVGSTDAPRFLEGGKRVAEVIASTLERNGVDPRSFSAILDFGVGCGRVLRHWNDLDGVEIHGTDYNRRLIEWSARNLPFASFRLN